MAHKRQELVYCILRGIADVTLYDVVFVTVVKMFGKSCHVTPLVVGSVVVPVKISTGD